MYRKFFAVCLSIALFFCCMPFSENSIIANALGDVLNADLSFGSISITSTNITYYDSSSNQHTADWADYESVRITQCDYSVQSTQNNITVTGNPEGGAKITLAGVNIGSYSAATSAISLVCANVEITLESGTGNTLSGSNGYAALSVPFSSSLTITGDGSLTAQSLLPSGGGAAIGGSQNRNCGDITIDSGVIYAYGRGGGAAIGGGWYDDSAADDPSGSITINGGYLVLSICDPDTNGFSCPALISNAQGNAQPAITINGSTIIADESYNISDKLCAQGSVLTINGGNITVTPDSLVVPLNNMGFPVYLNLITLPGAGNGALITGLYCEASYNTADMRTLSDGRVFIYLPEYMSISGISTENGFYAADDINTDSSGTSQFTLNLAADFYKVTIYTKADSLFTDVAINPYLFKDSPHYSVRTDEGTYISYVPDGTYAVMFTGINMPPYEVTVDGADNTITIQMNINGFSLTILKDQQYYPYSGLKVFFSTSELTNTKSHIFTESYYNQGMYSALLPDGQYYLWVSYDNGDTYQYAQTSFLISDTSEETICFPYQIIYDLNSGSGSIQERFYAAGMVTEISSGIDLAGPEEKPFFRCWKDSPDLTGNSYSGGETITINGDFYLYAEYSDFIFLFIEDGPISINASGVTQGSLTKQSLGKFSISQRNSSVATGNSISVSYVNADVHISDINIYASTAFSISSGGSVNLTLIGANHIKSTSNAGIAMSSGCSLSIFEQGTGSLTVQGASGSRPGIGVGGTVSVYSGTVSVTAGNGNFNSAWLGTGGAGGAGINGTLRVFGGSVTVKGGNGGGEESYGTGGNGGAGASELYISGGIASITAGAGGVAGSYGQSGHGGAGVYSLTSEGGTLSLKGGAGGNGTEYFGNGGSGGHGVSGVSVISGGSLLVLGGAAGKGTSYGNWGATGKSFSVQPTDGTNPLWLTTISVDGISSVSEMSSLGITSNYDINDVFTDSNGKIYLYLPAQTAVYNANFGETEYFGYIRQGGAAVSGSLTTSRLYRFTINTYHDGVLSDVSEDFSLTCANSLSTRIAQGVYIIYALDGDYDVLYNGVNTGAHITITRNDSASVDTGFYYVNLSGQNVTFNQKTYQTIPFSLPIDILAAADTGYTFHGLPQISGSGVDILVSSGGYRIKGTPSTDITASFSTASNSYTIFLSTQGKELENSPTEYVTAVYTSSTLGQIINPLTEYLEFAGWYTALGGTGKLVIGADGKFLPNVSGFTDSNGSYIKPEDSTLYAGWISNVTLSTEDLVLTNTPSALAKIHNNTNLLAQSVTNPVRDGYNFTGWYTGAGGTGDLVITVSGSLSSSTPEIYLDEDGNWICETPVTLYAGWSLKTYSLTISSNGGYRDGEATVEYIGSTVTIASLPLKFAYKATGYYADSACTELVCTIEGELLPNTVYTNSEGLWIYLSSVTLYTKWDVLTWDDGSVGIATGLYTVSGGSYNKTNNPYKISTAAELAYLSQQVSAYGNINDLSNNTNSVYSNYAGYKVISDISLGGENWMPITNFRGVFDADGHKISNLKITSSSLYTGLFGNTDRAAINNLFLENVDISINSSSALYIGSLIGFCSNSDVLNCSSSGVIILYGNSESNIYAGGVIGRSSYSKLTGLSSSVFLSVNSFNYSYVGGITGTDSDTEWINCFSSSDISSNSTYLSLGGLSGTSSLGVVKNCYAGKGSISGTAVSHISAGGICGSSYRGTYANCYSSTFFNSLLSPIVCKGQLIGNSDTSTVNACYISGISSTLAYGYDNYGTTSSCGYFTKAGDSLTVSAGTLEGFGSSQSLSYGTDLLPALNSWVTASADTKYAVWYPDCRYFPENDGLPQFKELPLYNEYRLLPTDKMKTADYFTSFFDFQGFSQIEIMPFSGSLCGTGTRIICTAQDGTKIYYVLILPGDLNGDSITDASDAFILELAVNGQKTLSALSRAAADIVKDEVLDEKDRAQMFKITQFVDLIYELPQTDKMKTVEYFTSNADFSGYSQIEVTPSYGNLCGTGTHIVCTGEGGKKTSYIVVLPGDLNGDSVTDSLDAFMLNLTLNGHSVLSEPALAASNVFKDGSLNLDDYQRLIGMSLGIYG
ncbi:MAG: hypothetical protein BWY46_00306 [Firmicutes bacterium ADurb.Bin300]|nr:MAG: hypothetical protein BWY46_00306 [Firmicutes bacterium ADurb.Bin300]